MMLVPWASWEEVSFFTSKIISLTWNFSTMAQASLLWTRLKCSIRKELWLYSAWTWQDIIPQVPTLYRIPGIMRLSKEILTSMFESCLSCDLIISLIAAGLRAISSACRIISGLFSICDSSGLRYLEDEKRSRKWLSQIRFKKKKNKRKEEGILWEEGWGGGWQERW